MGIDISQHITNNWPRTESELLADTDIDYRQAKEDAINYAKREAYGTTTPPSEADIPEIVGQWIADLATVRLIPLGVEYNSVKRFRSKSNQQGEQVSQYDLVAMLNGLREELESDVERARPVVQDLVGKSVAPRDVPKVSVDGLVFDPKTRALTRGLPA